MMQLLSRNLKCIVISLTLTMPMLAHAGLGDVVWTMSKKVIRIQVDNGSSSPVIYVVAEGESWEVPTCGTGVKYVQFYGNANFADEAYAAVLAAKTSGAKIKFRGICGPTSESYLVADYFVLE